MTARAPKAGKPATGPAVEPTEGETEKPPVTPPVEASTDTARSDGESVFGIDRSSTPDRTAILLGQNVVVRAVSSRAPYTRGGIRFASRREPVDLPSTLEPDQVRRLVADTAISLSLVHVETGKSVELPRDMFSAEGEPDFERLVALSEDLAAQVADELGRQVEASEGDA